MPQREDAGPPRMDDSAVQPITAEQAQLTREHARRWAVDDAEYDLFTTMLLGDE